MQDNPDRQQLQTQQQAQIDHWNNHEQHGADISDDQHQHHVPGDSEMQVHNNAGNSHQQSDPSSAASGVEVKTVQVIDQAGNETIVSLEGESSDSGVMKTPNSYKYPLLRQYYNFGPWIGRNRKAICLGCHLQTSSSQPDRLLKHLNRCTALSEVEKSAVQDLMNERTANKRKKPSNHGHSRMRGVDMNNDNTTEYYGDDKNSDSDCPIPAGGLKRLKHDRSDRTSQIDEALTRFIMMCRIPLKAIHSKEFIEFVKALDPDYRIPSRETITNVLIPGMLDIL